MVCVRDVRRTVCNRHATLSLCMPTMVFSASPNCVFNPMMTRSAVLLEFRSAAPRATIPAAGSATSVSTSIRRVTVGGAPGRPQRAK